MPPCPTWLCLLLATYMCTGAASASKTRRIPISSYDRNSDSRLLARTFDEDAFNRTKELSEKIDKVLKPHGESGPVTIAGPRFFRDPMDLPDMTFFSSYDTYESVKLTAASARGLSNFTVSLNNVGVPPDDVTQVHIHIYVTMGRLEVVGNFTLSPAPSSAPKSGPFNFTVVDLVAMGALKICRDAAGPGYRRAVNPYLPIQHDDMRLRLDNATLETDFLNYEIFESVEPRLRDQVRMFFDAFADRLIDKIRALDRNGTGNESTGWENLSTPTDPEPVPEVPTVKAFLSPGSVARSVPKSSYSPAMQNSSTADEGQIEDVGQVEDTAAHNRTAQLYGKIKRALEPYGARRGVGGPSPFFPDPVGLPDVKLTSTSPHGRDAANFTDVRLHGMSNFTVNVNWFGFFNDTMPVHVHVFLRTRRVRALGNHSCTSSGETARFEFTVDDLVACGVLQVSQDGDGAGYRRTVSLSDGCAGHQHARLRLDGLRPPPPGTFLRLLKYELLLAVQSRYVGQARQFFHSFGDTLVERLEAIDGENQASAK